MKQLYFCRHGQSVLNQQGLFAGSTETPLTDEGRRQAELEGIRAQGLGIDLIVSSPMSRALETAQIIARQIDYQDTILLQPLLVERDFGELEGTTYTTSIDLTKFPSAESDTRITARAEEAKQWLESLTGDTILVVSHGSMGRALRSLYQPEVDFQSRIPNAEVIKLL